MTRNSLPSAPIRGGQTLKSGYIVITNYYGARCNINTAPFFARPSYSPSFWRFKWVMPVPSAFISQIPSGVGVQLTGASPSHCPAHSTSPPNALACSIKSSAHTCSCWCSAQCPANCAEVGKTRLLAIAVAPADISNTWKLQATVLRNSVITFARSWGGCKGRGRRVCATLLYACIRPRCR